MADVDLKVKSTYAGKSQTLTISDANPQASDSVLLEFGQKINALTDNTYASTDKVTTVNLDTESSAGKQTATITLTQTTDTLVNVRQDGINNGGYIINFTFTGDAVPQVYTDINARFGGFIELYQGTYCARLLSNAISNPTAPFTATIVLPETDNYKSASATFTVTV